LATGMLGGDEVGGVVIDVGTSTTKAGFAGEESPKSVFPSVAGILFSNGKESTVGEGPRAVGETEDGTPLTNRSSKKIFYLGSQSLSIRRDGMEIHTPMENGLVSNWEVMEQIWSHTFSSQLRIDPKENPVLVAEPSFNTRSNREKMTELMFERYEVPAMFVAKNAVLAAFASGRATGVVVDAGAGGTSAVVVYDGYVLTEGISRTAVGGNYLNDELHHRLTARGVQILPRYMFPKREIIGGALKVTRVDYPDTHPSYAAFRTTEIVQDIKESACKVFEQPFDAKFASALPTVSYELPDGHSIDIGAERFQVPEILFTPPQLLSGPIDGQFGGIAKLVVDSVSQCDIDTRRELFGSVLVTGAGSLFEGFSERLGHEVAHQAPSYKLKISTPPLTAERRFGVWMGGSILGSLSSFHQLWMSKPEYEEMGGSLVDRKCP